MSTRRERRTAFCFVVLLITVAVSEVIHGADLIHIGGDVVVIHTLGVRVDASPFIRAAVRMLTGTGATA